MVTKPSKHIRKTLPSVDNGVSSSGLKKMAQLVYTLIFFYVFVPYFGGLTHSASSPKRWRQNGEIQREVYLSSAILSCIVFTRLTCMHKLDDWNNYVQLTI